MRKFLCVALILFALPIALASANVQRLAIVISRDLGPYNQAVQGVEAYLRDAEFDVDLSYHSINGEVSGDIANSILEQSPDLILTVGTEASRLVLEHTKDIPIVTSMVYDPNAEGFFDAKKKPNVFGAPLRVPWDTRFKYLKEFLPDRERYAVIYRPGADQHLIAGAEVAARKKGLKLLLLPVHSLQELMRAVQNARKETDALVMVLDRQLYNSATARELFLYSVKHRYPVVTFSPNYVKAGALISFSTDFHQNGKDAAALSAFLLDMEQAEGQEQFIRPKKVLITWNRQVAKALGVQLSESSQRKIDQLY